MSELQEILVYEANSSLICTLIKEVGNQIGSVHFLKRKDNSLRKMSYRLHVKNPTTAAIPKGLEVTNVDTSATDRNLSSVGFDAVKVGNSTVIKLVSGKRVYDRKQIDYANNQMTVLDVNKVVKDSDGEIVGRGGWRTIPLENVKQITCNKKRYVIKSWK